MPTYRGSVKLRVLRGGGSGDAARPTVGKFEPEALVVFIALKLSLIFCFNFLFAGELLCYINYKIHICKNSMKIEPSRVICKIDER